MSAKIKTANLFYFCFVILLLVLIAAYSVSREVIGDTQVYYDFYNSLIAEGLHNAEDCKSFEPLYCAGSYAIAKITRADWLTHYVWILIYFSAVFFAFQKFWSGFNSASKFGITSFVAFFLISINYVDPQAVSFLLRQYVASSLLVIGISFLMQERNPTVHLLLAILIHFGALPLALIILFFYNKNYFFIGSAMAATIVIIMQFSGSALIDSYIQSVMYKFTLYEDLSNGDVSFIQELKLIVYLALSIYAFRNHKRIWLAYISMYIFYLITFLNDLTHLRYYFYLESMIWPSMFFIFGKIVPPAVNRLHIMLLILSLRLTKILI